MVVEELFKGNVIIKLDPIKEFVNGIYISSATKVKKNKGKVYKTSVGTKFKEGDHVLITPRMGVLMKDKCLIEERDIMLIYKKEGMDLKWTKILIEPDAGEKITNSGIVVPDSVENKPTTGVIQEIGNQVTEFKKGDHVLFQSHAGIRIELKGKEIYLLEQSEVLAVL
jgi:co-chaperonin GroES (HSP10)